MMRRVVTILLAGATVFALSGLAVARDDKADATLKLSGGSVGVGIGYDWGSGVLTYEGKDYPVKIQGFSVGNVGAAQVEAVGQVYHLRQLQDFNGIYASATAGITVAGGGGIAAMRNQNGVEVILTATSRGLDLILAPEGVRLTLQ
jgi:hypothetical protein